MNTNEPLLKQVLGAEWDSLAPVIKKHYSLKPFAADTIHMKGVMEHIKHAMIAKLFILPGLMLGALIPYQGRKVPAEVYNWTEKDSAAFHWKRSFMFPGRKKPFLFRSYMHRFGNDQIIEYVRFGIGIKLQTTASNGGVVFKDNGYVWKLGAVFIPLPVNMLLGKAQVEEMPLSATEFHMKMEIKHPIFGKTFQYEGRFSF
ncbi:MAG: DUF4166 domain-containing protein [Gammaproteobacteria bacterium]|nr:DUF4166 domain-containing protein [Gammaproteobacteria bacterium]